MTTSSRIFVRGLPPNLTDDEFQRHFSDIGTITDSKLISHRRIGYIGYKSNDDASHAVKYYNRSFIRTSRIVVEPARSIDSQLPPKSQISVTKIDGTIGEVAAKSHMPNFKPEKRKQIPLEQVPGNTKLQEYLHVMQPPSKSKIWSNEGLTRPQYALSPALSPPRQNATREGDDGGSEARPKRLKVNARPERAKDPFYASERSPTTVTAVISQNDGILPELPFSHDKIFPITSDGDWLRSRTITTVDIDRADEALDPRTSTSTDGAPIQDSATLQEFPENDRSGQGSQAKVEPESQISVRTNSFGYATGRLFVRNLSYATTEDELREYFTSHVSDTINEVHLPRDHRSRNSKGFAYIQYQNPEAANRAVEYLDGKPFQGRLLHIIPADAKKLSVIDEIEVSKLPLKTQQQIKRKAQACSTFNWNSLYMSADAVMSSVSEQLGVPKSMVLDPTSSDAAVKQALAETHIIQETKAYFAANGVNLDAFQGKERCETAILVKNFSYGTTAQEIKALFDSYGTVTRVLMPPSGTISIVEFAQPEHARLAFGNLAYRKLKDSVLFLEKAPKTLFNSEHVQVFGLDAHEAKPGGTKPSALQFLEDPENPAIMETSTLFVKNLSFSTTTDGLREAFQELDGFASARVKMRPDPKNPGRFLSMGFGFLEFRSTKQAHAALCAMNGYKLDEHELVIRASHKALDAAEERRREDQAKKIVGTKIIIKNLPFEATKKDIRALLGSFGKLRSVRMPKKFDASTRGFAFADFVTPREAYNAMTALKDSHLLGRRLVLEFAAEDVQDPEKEIEKMQEKVGKQANKIALQQLTSVGRRKFNVDGSVDIEFD